MSLAKGLLPSAVLAIALCSIQVADAQTASAPTTVSLRWKPRLGEIHVYKVRVKFDYGQTAVQFNSDLKIKVIAIATDGGYTVQTSTTNADIDSGDEIKSLPPQPPVTQYYTKLGLPTGPSLANRDADPFSDMLDHLTEFVAPPQPVKVRDTWVNKTIGPKTSLFGEPRLAYTLVDLFRDGIRHMAKIRYQASIPAEPEAASGTLILDRVNNVLTQLDATIPHFKPEGASDEAAVSISIHEKEAS